VAGTRCRRPAAISPGWLTLERLRFVTIALMVAAAIAATTLVG